MVRTMPVSRMPSLCRVKRNRSNWVVCLQLLILLAVLSAWIKTIIPLPELVLPSGSAIAGQLAGLFHMVAKLLAVEVCDAALWQGVLLTGLVITLGCLIGYWTGMYGGASTNCHCYLTVLRPKSGVFISPE